MSGDRVDLTRNDPIKIKNTNNKEIVSKSNSLCMHVTDTQS